MHRSFLAAALALAACASAAFAQTQGTTRTRAGVDASTSASAQGRHLDIASGTHLTAELQDALDVSRARVGDRVLLKTTEDIKSNGQTVVKKGSRLVGHVADVQRRAKGSAASSVTVLFDRLESGSLSSPISATIDSITQGSARAHADNQDIGADAGASSRTTARTSSGSSSSAGGGLLGPVGNTVGGVTGAVTNTAGDVVGTGVDTVGGVTRGVGQTLGQIQITQSASADASGGSTLSLNGGNLRLEKGTAFHLTVNESASVNQQ
jgi:hypothetical protein